MAYEQSADQIGVTTELTAKPTNPMAGFAAVRLVLGLLLLIAASLKGYELATEPVAGQGLLGSRWFLIGLVEVEILLGLWLLSGAAARAAWWAALVLFGAFAVFTLQRAISGAESCGCFGKVQLNPWYTLVLDCLAIGALILWRPGPAVGVADRTSVHRGTVAAILAILIGVPAGWAMARYEPAGLVDGDIVGSSSFVILEPETWSGKPFPLAKHIDIGEQLVAGRWLVVLYRHDCPHCVESLPGYEQRARESADSEEKMAVALIAMPPYGSPSQDPVSPTTPCVRGKLSDAREWFVQTPAEITLVDGQVVAAEEGAGH